MSLFLEKFFKTLINNIPKDKKGIWRLIEAGNVLSKFFDSQMKTNNGKRKRKREEEGGKKEKKKRKVEEVEEEEGTYIPQEVMLKLFSYLNYEDLYIIMLTNKEIYMMLLNNYFWKNKFSLEFPGYKFPTKFPDEKEKLLLREKNGVPKNWKNGTKILILSLKEIRDDWVNVEKKYKEVIVKNGNELLLLELIDQVPSFIQIGVTYFGTPILESSKKYLYFEKYIEKNKNLHTNLLIVGFYNMIWLTTRRNINISIVGKEFNKQLFIEGIAEISELDDLATVPFDRYYFQIFDTILKQSKTIRNLLTTRSFVLKIVKKNGMFLFFTDKFQNDKDVVLFAVKNNGKALRFASNNLRDDLDVVLTAVKQNGLVIGLIPSTSDVYPLVVKAAIKQNWKALGDVPEHIDNYEEIIDIAMKQNTDALFFITNRERYFILKIKKKYGIPVEPREKISVKKIIKRYKK